MKKVLFLATALIILGLPFCKKDKTVSQQTITIGGLFSLTGNWSTLGITSGEAMSLATTAINNYMEQAGSRYRFTYTVFDTKLDTTLAIAGIRELADQNIRYFVGPQSSAEVGAIMGIAKARNLLVVSQSSTAGALADPGDAVFRFCPGDAIEGSAMAGTIFASGRRALVTLARDDAGNKGLQQVVGATFQGLGGTVDAIPPYAAATTDFSSLLATLKTKVEQHTATFGAGKVGVYLACFDGAKDLFIQASADPVFASVHWYGGDGITLSNAVASDATASAFAVATQFFAPSFGLPQQAHPDLAGVSNAIKSKTGLEPDAYALAVYDAMWVIARTVASFEETTVDMSIIKTEFQSQANKFTGMTGPITLNAAGDRTTGAFDYWGLVKDGSTYKWIVVGKSAGS